MRPRIETRHACVGGVDYEAHVKVYPARAAPHVSADSPRFLDPGSPRREEIVRIMRDRVDVTGEINYWTRLAIQTVIANGRARKEVTV